jgi:hypothetical protein
MLASINESDGESDWVTDKEYPNPRPSRGGDTPPNNFLDPQLHVWHCTGCAWLVLENQEDWMDEVEYGHSEDIQDCNVSITLHNLTSSLTQSRDLLKWVSNQPHLAADDLVDALWGSLSVIKTLSMHGLLNHAFESGDVLGAFWSQCLLVLWRILSVCQEDKQRASKCGSLWRPTWP